MAGGQGGDQGAVGGLALLETMSFPECHSVSTYLCNKVDTLFSILLTLKSISQLFPNLERNKGVVFIYLFQLKWALLFFPLYRWKNRIIGWLRSIQRKWTHEACQELREEHSRTHEPCSNWGKNVWSGGNNKCKDPEVGGSLACLRDAEKAKVKYSGFTSQLTINIWTFSFFEFPNKLVIKQRHLFVSIHNKNFLFPKFPTLVKQYIINLC